MRGTLTVSAALLAALCLSGCAGPSTFVSPTPPPDTEAQAWFKSDVPAVRAALARAMVETDLPLDHDASGPRLVVASRQQVPHVRGAAAPAPGPLPTYTLRARLSPADGTHVEATVTVDCPSCNGTSAYEWEYPGDLVKEVFQATRQILGERSPRFRHPPRFRPTPWRPPPR